MALQCLGATLPGQDESPIQFANGSLTNGLECRCPGSFWFEGQVMLTRFPAST